MTVRDDRGWTAAGIDGRALEALEKGVPATRLWSLLMGVMEQRAASRTPGQLMEQWARDGFTAPPYIDQRTLVELDAHLLAATRDFEAIELSPVAPLGVCSVVGLASQNKILSALRGTELVSDPTNVLALECARRLKEDAARLATSHRCIRAQELPKQPGFAPHFRIFCLATAGREQPDRAFLVAAVMRGARAAWCRSSTAARSTGWRSWRKRPPRVRRQRHGIAGGGLPVQSTYGVDGLTRKSAKSRTLGSDPSEEHTQVSRFATATAAGRIGIPRHAQSAETSDRWDGLRCSAAAAR